jgi:holliday junction DNA helicase RuvA
LIGYLEGSLRHLQADEALLMAGGVGYRVFIPLSTYYKLEGRKEASLFVHTHVREDALALYGFSTQHEKFAFEKLISISGIGPRLAQVILSGIEVSDLAEAIVRGDSRRLSSIPGVGKKTSERICLELRDKLVLAEGDAKANTAAVPLSLEDDVVSALTNLGYRQQNADAAVRDARKEAGADIEFSALLKLALRRLTR